MPLETCKWPVNGSIQFDGYRNDCFEEDDCWVTPLETNWLIYYSIESGDYDAYVTLYNVKMQQQALSLALFESVDSDWDLCYGTIVNIDGDDLDGRCLCNNIETEVANFNDYTQNFNDSECG